MKTIVNQKYDSPEVLQLKEVQNPIPKDTKALISSLYYRKTIQ